MIYSQYLSPRPLAKAFAAATGGKQMRNMGTYAFSESFFTMLLTTGSSFLESSLALPAARVILSLNMKAIN